MELPGVKIWKAGLLLISQLGNGDVLQLLITKVTDITTTNDNHRLLIQGMQAQEFLNISRQKFEKNYTKKLTKSRPLFFGILEILNSMDRLIVHWFALYVFSVALTSLKKGASLKCAYKK